MLCAVAGPPAALALVARPRGGGGGPPWPRMPGPPRGRSPRRSPRATAWGGRWHSRRGTARWDGAGGACSRPAVAAIDARSPHRRRRSRGSRAARVRDRGRRSWPPCSSSARPAATWSGCSRTSPTTCDTVAHTAADARAASAQARLTARIVVALPLLGAAVIEMAAPGALGAVLGGSGRAAARAGGRRRWSCWRSSPSCGSRAWGRDERRGRARRARRRLRGRRGRRRWGCSRAGGSERAPVTPRRRGAVRVPAGLLARARGLGLPGPPRDLAARMAAAGAPAWLRPAELMALKCAAGRGGGLPRARRRAGASRPPGRRRARGRLRHAGSSRRTCCSCAGRACGHARRVRRRPTCWTGCAWSPTRACRRPRRSRAPRGTGTGRSPPSCARSRRWARSGRRARRRCGG